MTKVASFIQKLHDLLEQHSSQDLHWLGDDAFEINGNDTAARLALSPKFDFRSLGSFNRQLSYYNFKRLSDKRRSVERQAPSRPGFIVFAHPSDSFVRGDQSRLHQIARKARRKSEKTGARRASVASAVSTSPSEPEHTTLVPPPMPGVPQHWISQREDPPHLALPPLGSRFGDLPPPPIRHQPQYPHLPLPSHMSHDDRAHLDHHAPHPADPHQQQYTTQPTSYGWRNRAAELGYRMQLPTLSHSAPAASGLTAAFAFSGEPSPSDSSYSTSTSGSPSWRPSEIPIPNNQPPYIVGGQQRLSPHLLSNSTTSYEGDLPPYSHAPAQYSHAGPLHSVPLPSITKSMPPAFHSDQHYASNPHGLYRAPIQPLNTHDHLHRPK